MKRRYWFLITFVISLGYLIFNSDKAQETSTESPQPEIEKKRTPDSTGTAVAPQPAVKAKNLPDLVVKKIPSAAPKELKDRWSHKSNFEDADYIDTQLHLDGKPIDGYFFKWSKNEMGEIAELVAGVLPEIEKVNGSFPSPGEFQQIVNSVIDSDTEVLSTQEIWNLNSHRVLTPQAKVEVQTKSRSQRSAGHEFWFINLNSGKIVKRVEADRN